MGLCFPFSCLFMNEGRTVNGNMLIVIFKDHYRRLNPPR